MQQIAYRLQPQPSRPLAIGARSVGIYDFPDGYREDMPPRPLVQCYWGVMGSGRLRYRGRWYQLRPNTVFCYPPMLPQILRSEGRWCYRWWTMDGDRAWEVVRACGLVGGLVDPAPTCPETVFRRLEQRILQVDGDAEDEAAAMAYQLVLQATRAPDGPEGVWLETVNRALAEGVEDPDFGVAALAKRLGVHRSTLSKRYHARTGSTPLATLTQLRMRRAVDLLLGTALPVAAVARRCGYRDADYFSRVVRQQTGQCPTGYRG